LSIIGGHCCVWLFYICVNNKWILMAAPATIGRRFTQLIQHLGISKNAFAQSLDKTATVIQHLVDERNKPGYDLLCKVFEVYPNVSKDWLLLGQGPMLTSGAGQAETVVSAAPTLFEPRATLVEPVQPTPQESTSPAPGSSNTPASTPSVEAIAAAPVAEPAPEKTVHPSTADPVNPPAVAPSVNAGVTEAMLTAALHAQYLQHQLALAEQRNQHLVEQQRLMQQLLDFAQRR
jgi:plasmid maintenance system antidote protein VapI